MLTTTVVVSGRALAARVRPQFVQVDVVCWGSKTVISESTSKITFPRRNLLDTLSVKSLEDKFQREKNPGAKKQTVQLDEWPSWTSPVRGMPQLDRMRNQLRHPPSWTRPVRRMAELGRSRCSRPVRNAPLPRLYRTRSCFISIGVAIGAL